MDFLFIPMLVACFEGFLCDPDSDSHIFDETIECNTDSFYVTVGVVVLVLALLIYFGLRRAVQRLPFIRLQQRHAQFMFWHFITKFSFPVIYACRYMEFLGTLEDQKFIAVIIGFVLTLVNWSTCVGLKPILSEPFTLNYWLSGCTCGSMGIMLYALLDVFQLIPGSFEGTTKVAVSAGVLLFFFIIGVIMSKATSEQVLRKDIIDYYFENYQILLKKPELHDRVSRMVLWLQNHLIADPVWFKVELLSEKFPNFQDILTKDIDSNQSLWQESAIVLAAVAASRVENRMRFENAGFRQFMMEKMIEEQDVRVSALQGDLFLLIAMWFGTLPNLEVIGGFFESAVPEERTAAAVLSNRFIHGVLGHDSLFTALSEGSSHRSLWNTADVFETDLMERIMKTIRFFMSDTSVVGMDERVISGADSEINASSRLPLGAEKLRLLSKKSLIHILEGVLLLLEDPILCKGVSIECRKADGVRTFSKLILQGEHFGETVLLLGLKVFTRFLILISESIKADDEESRAEIVNEIANQMPLQGFLQLRVDTHEPVIRSITNTLLNWYAMHPPSAGVIVDDFRLSVEADDAFNIDVEELSELMRKCFASLKIEKLNELLEEGLVSQLFVKFRSDDKDKIFSGSVLGSIFRALQQRGDIELSESFLQVFPRMTISQSQRTALAEIAYIFNASNSTEDLQRFQKQCCGILTDVVTDPTHPICGRNPMVLAYCTKVLVKVAMHSSELKRGFEDMNLTQHIIRGVFDPLAQVGCLRTLDALTCSENADFDEGFMEKTKKGAVHSPIGALLLRNFSEDVIVGLYMSLKRPVNDESLLFASRVLMRVFQNPHNRSTIISDHNIRLRTTMARAFHLVCGITESSQHDIRLMDLEICGNIMLFAQSIAVDISGSVLLVETGFWISFYRVIDLYVRWAEEFQIASDVHLSSGEGNDDENAGDGKEESRAKSLVLTEIVRLTLRVMEILSDGSLEISRVLRSIGDRELSELISLLADDELYRGVARLFGVWFAEDDVVSRMMPHILLPYNWYREGVRAQIKDEVREDALKLALARVRTDEGKHEWLPLPRALRLRLASNSKNYASYTMSTILIEYLERIVDAHQRRREKGWNEDVPLCTRDEVFWAVCLYSLADGIRVKSENEALAAVDITHRLNQVIKKSDGVSKLFLTLSLHVSEAVPTSVDPALGKRLICNVWASWCEEMLRKPETYIGEYVESMVEYDCLTFVALISHFEDWLYEASQNTTVMRIMWDRILKGPRWAECVVLVFREMVTHLFPSSLLAFGDEKEEYEFVSKLCTIVDPDDKTWSAEFTIQMEVMELLMQLAQDAHCRRVLIHSDDQKLSKVLSAIMQHVYRAVVCHMYDVKEDVRRLEYACLDLICRMFDDGRKKSESFARSLIDHGFTKFVIALSSYEFLAAHDNYKMRLMSVMCLVENQAAIPHFIQEDELIEALRPLVRGEGDLDKRRAKVRGDKDVEFIATCIFTKIVQSDAGKDAVVRSGLWKGVFDTMKSQNSEPMHRLATLSTVMLAAKKWKKKAAESAKAALKARRLGKSVASVRDKERGTFVSAVMQAMEEPEQVDSGSDEEEEEVAPIEKPKNPLGSPSYWSQIRKQHMKIHAAHAFQEEGDGPTWKTFLKAQESPARPKLSPMRSSAKIHPTR
eukprot:TRINITY_DN2874_c0_g1_i4.p1 TRINITY_DN2874_c0_g1~~TRINITY_DN2874_c0_g1_i4.p1  ORF type:complete len:1829 (+),score=452.53 TRINITY_DN2874_c0_g1_i4:514-5487(+)